MSGMGAAKEAAKAAKWYTIRSDIAELLPLYGMVSVAIGLALYTVKRTFADNSQNYNVAIRTDPFKQVEGSGFGGGRTGQPSLLYRVAQIKKDEKGYNIGVFDNRTRPFQYDKPGQHVEYN